MDWFYSVSFHVLDASLSSKIDSKLEIIKICDVFFLHGRNYQNFILSVTTSAIISRHDQSAFDSRYIRKLPLFHNYMDNIDNMIYENRIHEKFARRCPPTQKPTQKLKNWFLRFSSQEIGSSLKSFEMSFQALQSELFR